MGFNKWHIACVYNFEISLPLLHCTSQFILLFSMCHHQSLLYLQVISVLQGIQQI